MKIKPRKYQQECVDAIFDYFMENEGAPIVCIPGGGGKSLIQAMIAEKIITEYPECRVLFLTHRKELIAQNYQELINNMGVVDAGIYSAGLNCRDTENKIIFAGIQSIYKRALELGCFNIICIDECHLLSRDNNSMYLKFLNDMKEQAPYMKIIGLSATPYRLDSGLLTEGDDALFTDIIFDVSIKQLIKDGHLCELVGRSGAVKPDLTGVHKSKGEFIEKELAAVCDNAEIITKAVKEIKTLAADRKHLLLFCVGIEHAEHVCDEMNKQGMQCKVVHSKLPDQERNKILSEYQAGELRAIANVDILTVGYNAKFIDCICMLRPTESTSLYAQMCFRGTRLFPGKENCMILDFAGNILKHGAVDQIYIETKGNSGDRGVKTAPQKECPKCKQAIHLSAVVCPLCGYEFPVSLGHGETAIDADPISKYKPPVEYNLEPGDIRYYVHEKAGNLSMRVTYSIGLLESVSEWVCIQHEGYAAKKAREWLRKSLPAGYPVPDTVEECMELVDVYKRPCTIYVDYNQKFPRIISRIFPEEEEKEVVKNEEIIYKSFVR